VAETELDLPDFIEDFQLADVGEVSVRVALGTLHRGELERFMLARAGGKIRQGVSGMGPRWANKEALAFSRD
jgi:hypothetical protein